MKTLLLFRHAKSGWDTPDMRDFDRTLTERGIAAAKRMGTFVRDSGVLPDLVLCSPARRTCQTFEHFQTTSGCGAAVMVDDIYLASAETLLTLVTAQPDTVSRLMILGHNPGLEDLAALLVDPAASTPAVIACLGAGLATAALVDLDFATDQWRAVAAGSGRLKAVTKPKLLDG